MIYTKTPKTIVILAKHIDGGTGTFISQLMKLPQFFKQKIRIVVLVLEKPNYRLVDENHITVPITYMRLTQKYPQRYSFRFQLLQLLFLELGWLRRQIKKTQPAIIISIDTHSSLLAIILKLLFLKNICIVATIHNNISAVTQKKLSPLLSYILKFWGHMLFPHANAITTNSVAVATDFKNFFKLKQQVTPIALGINQQKIKSLATQPIPSSTEKRLLENKDLFKIISVGRLAPQKDFTTLITAFTEAKKQVSNLHLIILGDGEDKFKLKKQIDRLNLHKSIHIWGWKQNIHPYLKQADLFILSSLYEGFSYVLLEAMAAYLPIISTSAPYGPEEVLAGGKYGILTPVGDTQKLTQKIIQISKSKKQWRHYKIQAQKRSNVFTEDKMLQHYKNIVGKIIENNDCV